VAASERRGTGSSRVRARSLSEVAPGETVQIHQVDLEADTAAWLAAVGLERGEEVTVLRKAILGGPLHLRLARGGELAVARDVAMRIAVEDA
jgi:ferrous iron transport protein A